MTLTRRILYLLVALLVTAAALGLHLRAVRMLPVDYDEDDYLAVAQRYTRFLADGDVGAIVDYAVNYEHPPLTKLVYGIALLPLPRGTLVPEQPNPNVPPARSLPQPDFRTARTVSAALGTLEVGALALLNPIAGLLLAVNTWQLKYTSQIMLEPLPALTSLLAVLFYFLAVRAGSSGKRRAWWTWLALSAVALGVTAASKYTYCVAGLAIIADSLLVLRDARRARALPPDQGSRTPPPGTSFGPVIRYLALWALIAVIVFFIANPRMWSHPLERLLQSVLYHGNYAQSAHVKEAGYPMWQPLVWLLGPVPWHPGVFIVMIDTLIALLAAVGMARLWARYRVFALWFIIGFGFLLIWPTKWPQYILTITAPLSLAAALGLEVLLWEPLARLARTLRQCGTAGRPVVPCATQTRSTVRRETRRALPWLMPGLIALGVLALFPLIYQAAMSLTDFNAVSIRDGVRGGVWRAVWEGLSGQASAVALSISQGAARAKEVHWAGHRVLIDLLGGGAPDLLAFNILWATLATLIQSVLGVGAALLLNRRGVRWRTFWRTVFILPWAVPEFVGALIWLRILDPDFGWLALSGAIPADALRGQMTGPDATLVQLLVAATWYGFPFIMLAATAALKMAPDEVYDAAAIDGAGPVQQLRWITWPLLLPLLAPAILIRSIFSFNQFYLFYTMRVNFPTVTFATASFYLMSPTGPFGGQFAVAAAVNIFTMLVLLVLVIVLSRWTRSESTEEATYA